MSNLSAPSWREQFTFDGMTFTVWFKMLLKGKKGKCYTDIDTGSSDEAKIIIKEKE